ncbi:MAG: hypothetical protein IIB46_06495, partial [Nitrospinae bacterium]|nr:hypothetical protein [Nitrospinota bacterium]
MENHWYRIILIEIVLGLLIMPVCLSDGVYAEESEKKYFAGSWGGQRDRLEEKGITFEVVYTGEVFSVVSGGIDRKTEYLDNIDVTLTIDVEELWGWEGATC